MPEIDVTEQDDLVAVGSVIAEKEKEQILEGVDIVENDALEGQ